jgi:peptidoglycan/LPS O-acetylase OafA/YrhL
MIRPRSGFLALLGDASYSLYLVHFPLISALCKLVVALGLTGVLGATVAFPVILASCLLVAIALHLYVEKPLLAWLSQPVRDRAAAQ